MLRYVVCAALLFCGQAWAATGSAAAENWYVRPTGACANNGDGLAYSCAASAGAAGAFIGLNNVIFTSTTGVDNNDALYVCGAHSVTSNSDNLNPSAGDGADGSPISIDFRCPGDPGFITGTGSVSGVRIFDRDYFSIYIYAPSTITAGAAGRGIYCEDSKGLLVYGDGTIQGRSAGDSLTGIDCPFNEAAKPVEDMYIGGGLIIDNFDSFGLRVAIASGTEQLQGTGYVIDNLYVEDIGLSGIDFEVTVSGLSVGVRDHAFLGVDFRDFIVRRGAYNPDTNHSDGLLCVRCSGEIQDFAIYDSGPGLGVDATNPSNCVGINGGFSLSIHNFLIDGCTTGTSRIDGVGFFFDHATTGYASTGVTLYQGVIRNVEGNRKYRPFTSLNTGLNSCGIAFTESVSGNTVESVVIYDSDVGVCFDGTVGANTLKNMTIARNGVGVYSRPNPGEGGSGSATFYNSVIAYNNKDVAGNLYLLSSVGAGVWDHNLASSYEPIFVNSIVYGNNNDFVNMSAPVDIIAVDPGFAGGANAGSVSELMIGAGSRMTTAGSDADCATVDAFGDAFRAECDIGAMRRDQCYLRGPDGKRNPARTRAQVAERCGGIPGRYPEGL